MNKECWNIATQQQSQPARMPTSPTVLNVETLFSNGAPSKKNSKLSIKTTNQFANAVDHVICNTIEGVETLSFVEWRRQSI